MSDNKNCFGCRYRENIPGDAHSCCKHPDLDPIWRNPLSEIISLSGKRFGTNIMINIPTFNIKRNEHGFTNGYFQWPWNFDPIWMENCDKRTE